MPIRVKCEKCKKTLSVKDHLAGKKIKCPVCQSVVGVPLASPTKEAPAAKPAPKAAAPDAAKKPAAAVKTKPKPDTNGSAPPSTNGEHLNGKAPPPKPIELPPENVEEEALSALADEPPPPEEVQEPQFVEFKCQWCDEDVKLPIELAGKQSQCPNPECKRIVKVPLPKAPEKKDWRKMERQGPAAAKINLPEALDNAWGTEEATRARQDSLAKAGAVEAPPKPPLGLFGWLQRGFYGVAIVLVLAALGYGGFRLVKSNEQHNVLEDIKNLTEGRDPKIKEPVLKAEAERTRGLYHLHGNNPKLFQAIKAFGAARISVGEEPPPLEKPMLDEQFFLIDLALSQIDLGGTGDDLLTKKRLEWGKMRDEVMPTLQKIKSPEIQVIALRQMAARLDQLADLKERRAMAIGFAGGLSAPVNGKRPLPFRQQIALVFSDDKKLPGIDEPDLAALDQLEDADLRVGFAEGYARKGNFESAFKLAKFPGPEEHKLEALLGIAAVALALDKQKDQSAQALKDALEIAKDDKKTVATPWHWFEIACLGARLDDKEAVKQAIERHPPPFKLRAQLEVFLALCDRSATPVSTDALSDLAAEDKEGVTLALAWMALARQHARTSSAARPRAANLKTFDDYAQTSSLPPNILEMIRPMVIIGTYQRTK